MNNNKVSLEKKLKAIDSTSQISPVKETEGLSAHEIVALVTIMQNFILYSWMMVITVQLLVKQLTEVI